MLGQALRGAFNRYSTLLETRPVATRSVTAFCVVSSGDLVAQCITHRPRNYRHAAGMGMYGACLIAPIGYGFFNLLRRIVPPSSSPLKRALKKLALDLTIWQPSFSYAFWLYNGLVLGDGGVTNMEQAIRRANALFLPTLINAYCFWPFANFITFYCIPFKFRLLWRKSVSFSWNTFLCWYNSKYGHSPLFLYPPPSFFFSTSSFSSLPTPLSPLSSSSSPATPSSPPVPPAQSPTIK
ncbi:Mpv17 / PMP22 family protein [Acanthamoeba castellanii str. Neff]|uniref:Mpv17 / PMP22 family protein n=1 Tax=Acanthamoeba castellanii (strain ATCC 30010 / Neff) TaxID=1257118 RepID=L8GQX8_ACACF|nr:Mpv17 / PMP22 family protein [Acanthamoeba castellanii str. Neff]ELR14531.1 Mpv17 / PMP22 family protein [Acanthamoeba castellanii str. Neff]